MIAEGGYQWHYIDGLSDDGRYGIVLIALLGSPFSPAYGRARELASHKSAAGVSLAALDYCALNVAIYDLQSSRARAKNVWSLRERSISEGDRSAHELQLKTSCVAWNGDALVVDVDERTTPFGRPIRGRVTLRPEVLPGHKHILDFDERHAWWPVAPLAKIEVDLREPDVRFVGSGYHDANAGSVPLEASFDTWSWARARTDGGGVRKREKAFVTYDILDTEGRSTSVAWSIDTRGRLVSLEPSSRLGRLPTSTWGLAREARSDAGHQARVLRSLEDGPFYARSLVATTLGGERVTAMHETLAADRLARGWVRFLAGFRMGKAKAA